MSPTTATDGGEIAAMAYHSYPWANSSSTNLAQFFGALDSTRNISYTAAHMRSLDTAACASCTNLPIEIGEYNAGPFPVHSPFTLAFPGASFLAESFIQGIEANVSMLTTFELSYLYNSSIGVVQPQGVLYQTILANLTMGEDFPVAIHAGSLGGIAGLLVKNGSREALLLVNDNTTRALRLTISAAAFPVGLLGSEWYWGPGTTVPSVARGITVPSSYTLGSEGMLLVTNY